MKGSTHWGRGGGGILCSVFEGDWLQGFVTSFSDAGTGSVRIQTS